MSNINQTQNNHSPSWLIQVRSRSTNDFGNKHPEKVIEIYSFHTFFLRELHLGIGLAQPP